MPRTPRNLLPDGPFHVMARAPDGNDLFRADADRRFYLGLMQRAVEHHRWRLLTFVLMRNHVHLLVVATVKQLSEGLWETHWRYAEHFKATYEPHFGHVFGNRPKTKPITSDRYLIAVARYIARNPLGVNCDRPEEYAWSAHRAIIGASAPLPILAGAELIGWFGSLRRYEECVTGRTPMDEADVRRWVSDYPQDRPALEALVADPTPDVLRAASKEWGYSIRAISEATGLSYRATRNAIAGGSRGLAP